MRAGQPLSPVAQVPAQGLRSDVATGARMNIMLGLNNTDLTASRLSPAKRPINLSLPTNSHIAGRRASRGGWIILDLFHHRGGNSLPPLE